MSTSAASTQTTRDAIVKDWTLHIAAGARVTPVLDGAELQIDAIMRGPNSETTIIRGNTRKEQHVTPFEGFYDSEGAVHFSLEVAGVTYTFYGVTSPSGLRMAGFINPSLLNDDVEDEATWSAQARGIPPGEKNKPGHPRRK